jgi:hypothetical protein
MLIGAGSLDGMALSYRDVIGKKPHVVRESRWLAKYGIESVMQSSCRRADL